MFRKSGWRHKILLTAHSNPQKAIIKWICNRRHRRKDLVLLWPTKGCFKNPTRQSFVEWSVNPINILPPLSSLKRLGSSDLYKAVALDKPAEFGFTVYQLAVLAVDRIVRFYCDLTCIFTFFYIHTKRVLDLR